MLTMDTERELARQRIDSLEPAHRRILELLDNGHDVRYIASRFDGATTQAIYKELGRARRAAGVVDTEHLIKLYRKAQ